MPVPGLDLLLAGGQGGISIAPSSSADTGPTSLGGFYFAPKSSTLPPVAWIAIAAVAGVALLAFTRRRG